MNELVFLEEEPSMARFLNKFLHRILSYKISPIIIPHQGKGDLKKSIPIKLGNWQTPAKFIILIDKDSNDCKKLKSELQKLCTNAGRPDTIIRIVCTELESWYLGDLESLEKAFNVKKLRKQQNTKKFRDPDNLGNPYEELKKIVPSYQKISGSEKIAQHINLNPDFNTSKSFNVFVKTIKNIKEEYDETVDE